MKQKKQNQETMETMETLARLHEAALSVLHPSKKEFEKEVC